MRNKYRINEIIQTIDGLTVKVTAVPDADYVYGRVQPTGTFIVVNYGDIIASELYQESLLVGL